MPRLFALLFALALTLPAGVLRAQNDPADPPAPRPPEPFPSAYKDDEILSGSVSPDGKCGLIFPKRNLALDMEHPELLLVALKPFRVLTKISLRYSVLFHGHNSYEVHWAKDSSALTMVEGIKWGPDRVFLVPVHDSQAGKIVDLTAEVERIVRPSYRKSKARPFNENIEFIFESDDGEAQSAAEQWLPDEHGHVKVLCFCTNDPKDIEKPSWTVRFNGTWNIAAGKWVQQKTTRLRSGPGKNGDAAN